MSIIRLEFEDENVEVRYAYLDSNFEGTVTFGQKSPKYNRFFSFSAKEWNSIFSVFGNGVWKGVTRIEFSGNAYNKTYVIFDHRYFVGQHYNGDNEFVAFSKEEWQRIVAAFAPAK